MIEVAEMICNTIQLSVVLMCVTAIIITFLNGVFKE